MAAQQIGIAIVVRGMQVLVGVRAENQVLAGKAEFPGGKCEANESPEDCSVRECLEETNLAVEAVSLLERKSFCYPHGEVDLHFWLCRLKSESTSATPANGFRWIDLELLTDLEFPEANGSVIARLREC